MIVILINYQRFIYVITFLWINFIILLLTLLFRRTRLRQSLLLMVLKCLVQLLFCLLFTVQSPPASDNIQNLSLLLMVVVIVVWAEMFADNFFDEIDSSEDEGDVKLFLYFINTYLFLLHLCLVPTAFETPTHLVDYVTQITK